jgi:hypothetical protein
MKQAQRNLEAGPDAAEQPGGEAPRPAAPAAAAATGRPAAALALRCSPVDRELVMKLIDGLKAL